MFVRMFSFLLMKIFIESIPTFATTNNYHSKIINNNGAYI
jgi:hypothetical protein